MWDLLDEFDVPEYQESKKSKTDCVRIFKQIFQIFST